jgi:hypothetical protein
LGGSAAADAATRKRGRKAARARQVRGMRTP